MDQSSAAEQRAFAVAKLKRAASLPRMKDGRRPPMPMHVEAVSEGERSLGLYGNDDGNTPTPEEHIVPDIDDPPPLEQQQQQVQELDQELLQVHHPEPHHEQEHDPEPEPEHEPEPEPEPEPEQPEPATRTTKRRSRSRSRSRGSKDLKLKQRPILSPTHSPLAPANDSSQDESPPPPPPTHIPATPPLVSPIPSHAELQRSRLLMSPAPTSPELSLFYPGTSPPTPMLPSLEALQKGVFRSNSAAARMMAMHKLTGGTETYDHPFSSPSPTPPLERLVRNNTVSGGERLAARKIMLRRLGERIKEVDAEQTSGGEDIVVPTPPKRRRRRSRRSSAGNAAISDSDFVPTSPNTPLVPPTPLPVSFDNIPDPPPQRTSSATPSQNISSQIDDSQQLAQQQQQQQPQQDNRHGSPSEHGLTRRRSILVEDDDIPDENIPPFSGLPSTPQRLHAQVAALRVPHASDAPSTTSTDSTSPTAIGVPVYFSSAGTTPPPRSDLFPTSPFTTPLKERPSGDDDEEQVLYQAENHQQRAQYRDAFDREISWVADPGQYHPILDEHKFIFKSPRVSVTYTYSR
jgi:serine/arginine repetitive matrix protein 2